MAKMLLAPGIESLSGAMSGVNRKSQHVDDQNMFLATHRVAATTSRQCQRAYFRKTNTLPWAYAVPSDKVLQLREDFTTRAQAISARRTDLTVMSADMAGLKAYRARYPESNMTLFAFYWLAASTKYWDDEKKTVTFPANSGIDLLS